MPFDGSKEDLETDFEILEAIGEHVDGLILTMAGSGAPQKTLRRWIVGHCEPPEDPDTRVALMAAASDLELFTPSASGRTTVDRHVQSERPESDLERKALQALGAARFRLVTIVGREGPDLVKLKDEVTGEILVLLDERISPLATQARTAMRLCPLASGRQVLISPLFIPDDATFAAAMAFARGGKLPGNGYRCAANLYRDIARRGFTPMPTEEPPPEMEALGELTEVQRLSILWLAAEQVGDPEARAELTAEIRRKACLHNILDACAMYGDAVPHGHDAAKSVFAEIADILVETLSHRAHAGVRGSADILDQAGAHIDREVAAGRMEKGARELFRRLRTRWSSQGTAGRDKAGEGGKAAAERADVDRVIQLIQALRAKTVDRGCTEEEAMAAAAKVAELLARHDLTLDEIGVRRSDCTGVAVDTGRKRRAPIDSCMSSVAAFCDCRVWSEGGGDGALRYIFFGLKADVEAARFLRDLIDSAFETESEAFRQGPIYRALYGGERRSALNSFQVGLASGISAKLNELKTARSASAVASSGRDLVAIKDSVLDDEIDKLGLNFTRKSASRRFVNRDAYAAGKAAGALFEPNAALAR